MKKALVIILVLAAGGAAVWFFTRSDSRPASSTSQETSQNQPSGEEPAESVGTAATVTYNGSSFSPARLTVKPGTKATFVNQSNRPLWVASDPHPVHTDLSGFDAGKSLVEGESYSFTFEAKGTWGYHNHVDFGRTGTIVVE